MKTRHIAQVALNVASAILVMDGLADEHETVLPWNAATDRKRKQFVDWANFHLANPEATPADAHASWKGALEAEGWIYGEERSELAKTHPDLVLFAMLPMKKQAVGHAVKAAVNSLDVLRHSYIQTSPISPAPAAVEAPAEVAPVVPVVEVPVMGIDMGAGDETAILDVTDSDGVSEADLGPIVLDDVHEGKSQANEDLPGNY